MYRGLFRRGRRSVQCLFLFCLADFSAPSSSPLYVSSQVGHEVTLPCNWTSRMEATPSSQSPYLQWQTPEQSVFEMRGEARYEGSVYKGRVKVVLQRFEGGDCSLVLSLLQFSDTGLYESFVAVGEKKRRFFIESVQLAVRDHKYREQLGEGESFVLKLHTPQAATVIFQGGSTTESKVIWKRKGWSQERLMEGDQILTLSGVKLDDSGTYKVLDPEGLAVSTVHLKVNERIPEENKHLEGGGKTNGESGRDSHSTACRESATSLAIAASLLFFCPHVLL